MMNIYDVDRVISITRVKLSRSDEIELMKSFKVYKNGKLIQGKEK